MELFIFARLHARQGQEKVLEGVVRRVVAPTRAEAGCLSMQVFRSTKDPGLFYIHSRWVDEAAFDNHVGLPHTVRLIEELQPVIDHSLDVTRTALLE